MRIFIATFNPGKQKEFKRILSNNANLKIYFPQNLKITEEVEETGKTFEENSALKAKFYFNIAKIPTIADDGGLEIESLGGAPGVKSRRWLGYKGTDSELLDHALEKLKKYKNNDERTAAMKVCLTFFDGENIFQESDKINGFIAKKPNNNYPKGYPFRGLFIVLPINKYYDDLTVTEHKKYNHRERALNRLWKRIIKLYNV